VYIHPSHDKNFSYKNEVFDNNEIFGASTKLISEIRDFECLVG
jgi:hypothetical protein